jgi:hypothetical protein
MESSGLSSEVVDLLMGGVRNTTSAAYQSAWNGWHNWCIQQGADPMSPSLAKVLEFLSWQVGEGKAYRTVNVSRSMLSSTLGKIDGFDIGKHPLVVKLMKGAYNKKPPVPRYTGFWDINLVINYIISLGSNNELSFSTLSTKLAVLLALSSLCRVSELANIVRDSIVIDDDQAKFALSTPRKSHRASPLQLITLKKLHPVSLACPVEILKQYISVSEPESASASKLRKRFNGSTLDKVNFIRGGRGHDRLFGPLNAWGFCFQCGQFGGAIGRYLVSRLLEVGVYLYSFLPSAGSGGIGSKCLARGSLGHHSVCFKVTYMDPGRAII